MMTDKVIVKKSAINGNGVFAIRDFKKGEVILHWDISHVLTKEAVDKMSNDEKKYISLLNNTYVIMQEPEKFVNHSCEANTTAKDFCDVAVRDIREGEEITADYTEELPANTSMECHCGSSKCKKIIFS
jgi:uncharacterized protein